MIIYLESSTIVCELLGTGRALMEAFFPKTELHINQVEEVHRKEDKLESAVLRLEVSYNNEDGKGSITSLQGFWQCINQGQAWPEGVKKNALAELAKQEVLRILTQPAIGKETPNRLIIKHGINKLLSSVCGRDLPWGILTGIRPSKLLHRLDDLEIAQCRQGEVLQHRYGIRADRIQVLEEIVAIQRPFLQEFKYKPKRVAVYVGIPFCLSRCTYCTFPGYLLDSHRNHLGDYLSALHEEIKQTGELMKAFQIEVDSLYLGGGTPTILTENELEKLNCHLKHWLPVRDNLEFTVEAGRPDSLGRSKLEGLIGSGVTRISINPQSMHNQTLHRIGRKHTAEDICNTFSLARSLSDWIINMDMILGLPGEDLSNVQSTLKQIKELGPDNLTVHALAIKRGSIDQENGYNSVDSRVMEEMSAMTSEVVKTWGLHPYYLYRQKRIAGNMENIGYSIPGKECRYNIGMMEERQTIFGLGSGATSKMINPKDYSLENFRNPIDIKTYIKRVREGQHEKWAFFRNLFSAERPI